MPITGAIRQPSSMSKMYVYIDDYDGIDFRGRLFVYNGSVKITFDSMLDMLKGANAAFDRLSFPQAVFKSRSFDDRPNNNKDEGTRYPDMEQQIKSAEHESKSTFVIHVKFRQNGSWQGEIKWVNQNKVQHFRSSLEMIKLMDMAVSSEFGEDVKIEWE